MPDPYLGELRIFAGPYAPTGWSFCDGSSLQVDRHAALFSLLGTTYGGDGVKTFKLPDLRGRAVVGAGGAEQPGQRSGASTVELTTDQIPAHSHALRATADPADAGTAAGNVLAASETAQLFAADAAPGQLPNALAGDAVTNAGGSAAHDNMQPYLAISYIIALTGVYPSRG